MEKATAHQTITLGTGTEFRIGQGDGSAHVKGALPQEPFPRGKPTQLYSFCTRSYLQIVTRLTYTYKALV